MNDNHIELSDSAGLQAARNADTSSAIAVAEENFGPNDEYSSALPPPDTGKDAWLFLAACFMMEALVWGFPFAFGIFQQYFSTHEPFKSQGNTAVVGTCAMGIIYLSGPVVFPMLRKWPSIRRPSVVLGLLAMCLSLAISSFSTTVTHLILTQGVGYAIGGAFAYSPTILFVDEWFIKRKGLAFGIMWAGTGVAGVAIPLVLQWMLDSYGYRTALRAWSLSLFLLTAPLLYWVKPRLPHHPSTHNHPRGNSNRTQILVTYLSFMLTPQFTILQLCNILEALGYFLPGIYLPLFAEQVLSTGRLTSAFTVILVNIASVFGCIAMGSLVDRYHVTTCIMLSSLGATLGIFLLWGLSYNLAMLYAFCAVYGFFAGSFSASWTGVIGYMQESVDSGLDSGLVFAVLAFGRGIGNLASGPISEVLVKGVSASASWGGDVVATGGNAYASGYGALIVFTGVSAGLGGGSFLFRRLGVI